jgi:hypothetical protein
LLIIGGAAVAVIIAIVAVVMLATQGPSRKPAAKPSGATTAPASPSRADVALLGAQEIGTILNDPNMVSGGRIDQLRSAQGTLSKPECVGAFEPLEESVYRDRGTTAVHGEIIHTAGDDPAHRVVETAASFGSPEKARAFVEASAEKWGACGGQTIRFISSSKSTEWTVEAVTGAAPKISQVRTQTDGSDRTCQHVLSAVADVVIDVQACGLDIADGAGRIAEQMGARAAK